MGTRVNITPTFFISNTGTTRNSLSVKPVRSSCKLVGCPRSNSSPKVCRLVVASSDYSDTPFKETIDIQLPRRSLLVHFTCNSCAQRTQRYINRLAYERGLVYVQCAGCLKYHKLVDNLGLVLEHNLLEDTDTTPSD